MSHKANGNGTETAIIGVSSATLRAIATARRFAPTQIPILLTGETGTGKELFAQEIHRWSGRNGPFVDVNCGALPRDLVEGELFGHRRGAYTGANSDSRGLIAHAHGGTLFLDEMSSLPLEGQVKLLRVLETREIRRVGDTTGRQVDFRLIAAVQDGLGIEVREGRFRIDLYQRLAGVVIHLSPLERRLDDLLPLARHFAHLHQRTLGKEAELVLTRHNWPGNIRELKSVVDRAVVLTGSGILNAVVVLEAIDLGSNLGTGRTVDPADTPRWQEERSALLSAGERADWNRHLMAGELGISMATLYRRLRMYRISLLTHSNGSGSHYSHPTREKV